MCGRVTVRASGETLQRAFRLEARPELRARFNLAPTQAIPAVLGGGPRVMELLRWGLIPSWAKDPSIASKLINARAETLAEKPSFRDALGQRRCVVLVDGFYEWRRDGKARLPFHIQRRAGAPMAFAGLWDEWRAPSGEAVRTCTLITTAPNALMKTVHDRMPLILTPPEVDEWLVRGPLPSERLGALLQTSRVEDLELRPVSSRVNDVAFDEEACLADAAPRPVTLELFA